MYDPIRQIRDCLGCHPWADHIHYFNVTDSTNTQAKHMAANGAPDGTVLIAEQQLGGRGRLGRQFFSPPGMGVYLSVILRPNCSPNQLMHLTCAAAVAACDAVEAAANFRPDIKWTNDLIVGNRKLGGILTELSIDPKNQCVEYAVVGIGINCCQTEADFDSSIRSMACSIQSVTGRQADRVSLISELIKALYAMDKGLLAQQETILNRYRNNCRTLGKQVSIVQGDQIRHATALDIDPQGALIVRYADGSIQSVSSGEVSIRGLYGYI